MARVPYLVLSALLVAGCASNEQPQQSGAKSPQAAAVPPVNLAGYPPEFRDGYTQGCAAARRNDAAARPKGDGQFAVGWNDGFDYCKAKK